MSPKPMEIMTCLSLIRDISKLKKIRIRDQDNSKTLSLFKLNYNKQSIYPEDRGRFLLI